MAKSALFHMNTASKRGKNHSPVIDLTTSYYHSGPYYGVASHPDGRLHHLAKTDGTMALFIQIYTQAACTKMRERQHTHRTRRVTLAAVSTGLLSGKKFLRCVLLSLLVVLVRAAVVLGERAPSPRELLGRHLPRITKLLPQVTKLQRQLALQADQTEKVLQLDDLITVAAEGQHFLNPKVAWQDKEMAFLTQDTPLWYLDESESRWVTARLHYLSSDCWGAAIRSKGMNIILPFVRGETGRVVRDEDRRLWDVEAFVDVTRGVAEYANFRHKKIENPGEGYEMMVLFSLKRSMHSENPQFVNLVGQYHAGQLNYAKPNYAKPEDNAGGLALAVKLFHLAIRMDDSWHQPYYNLAVLLKDHPEIDGGIMNGLTAEPDTLFRMSLARNPLHLASRWHFAEYVFSSKNLRTDEACLAYLILEKLNQEASHHSRWSAEAIAERISECTLRLQHEMVAWSHGLTDKATEKLREFMAS